LEQIELQKKNFIEKMAAIYDKISQKYDQLMALVQSHRRPTHLMEELESLTDKRLKEMESSKDEVQRQLVIMESFKEYCVDVKKKGAVCVIALAANDLHARAEELVKIQQTYSDSRIDAADIIFTSSVLTSDSAQNLIGYLAFEG